MTTTLALSSAETLETQQRQRQSYVCFAAGKVKVGVKDLIAARNPTRVDAMAHYIFIYFYIYIYFMRAHYILN